MMSHAISQCTVVHTVLTVSVPVALLPHLPSLDVPTGQLPCLPPLPAPVPRPPQTFIKNLVQGWGVKSMGAAFESGGRTSPEQFRRDPASMRLETLPIIDKGASKGLVISIQVRPE